MDSGSIWFVLLMSAVGGLTAYVADTLGFKIGKKRLSLWKIRPRNIARISVVAAGLLIPLITIGLISVLSSDIRTWLVKGRAAVEEAKQKSAELRVVSKNLVAATEAGIKQEKKNRDLAGRLGTLGAELESKKREQRAAEARLKALGGSLERQNRALSSAIRQADLAQSRVGQLNLQNAKIQRDFAQTKSLLTQEKRDLTASRKLLSEVNQKRSIAERDYGLAVKEFNNINERNLALTRENGELQRSIANLNQSIETLKAEMTKAADEERIAIEAAEAARNDLTELQRQLREYQEARKTMIQDAQSYLLFSRSSEISYRRGEELIRQNVPVNLDPEGARNFLTSFLRQCRIQAEERGAKESMDSLVQGSAGIVEQGSKEGEFLSLSEAEDRWASTLTNGREPRVLIARSGLNHFAGEPVLIKLTIARNPVAFKVGEVIAEGRVDGRTSNVAIFSQIRQFVQTSVNARAKAANVIPVVTKDGEQYGNLTADEVLAALDEIRRIPRVMRIQAVAKTDVRVGGPMSFDLVLK